MSKIAKILGITTGTLCAGVTVFTGVFTAQNPGIIKDYVKGNEIYTSEQMKDVKSSHENEVTDLNNELVNLKASYTAAQNALNAEKAKVYDLEKTVADLTVAMNNNEQTIATLTSSNTELQTQVTTLTNEVATKQETVLSLESQVEANNTRIAELEAQGEADSEEIANLQASNTSLNAQISTLNADIQSKTSEIDTLNSTINVQKSTIANLTNENTQLSNTITTLNSDIEEYQSRIEELEEELANAGSGESTDTSTFGLFAEDGTQTYTWQQLQDEGIIAVNDGVVSKVEGKEDLLAGNLVIADDVTSIADYGFANCKNLTGLSFTDNSSITTIGNYLLSANYNILSLTIPATVTSFGEYAFTNSGIFELINKSSCGLGGDNNIAVHHYQATDVESVLYEQNNCVFADVEGTQALVRYKGNEKDVVITSDLLGEPFVPYIYAFSGNENIETIKFGSEITAIYSDFITVPNLISVTFESETMIEGSFIQSFVSNNVYDLIIYVPSSILATYQSETSALPQLSAMFQAIPGSEGSTTALSAGLYAEDGTTTYSWQQLIDENIITVTDGTLAQVNDNAKLLVGKLIIKDDVSKVSYLYSSLLTSVYIPSSVTEIAFQAFNNCTTLTEVVFAEDSQLLKIGGSAFKNCSNLKRITIPASVITISDNGIHANNYGAFQGCSSLEEVIFEENSKLELLGKGAFSLCSSLKKIDIPSSVQEIRGNAFSNCTSLEYIIIPSSVTTIYDTVFYNTSSSINIILTGSPSNLVNVSELAVLFGFAGLSNITANFYIPNEYKDEYLSAHIWSDAAEIYNYYDNLDILKAELGIEE